MGIIALLKNFFGAAMAALGFAKQRDAERNAPDMKAAAEAQDEQTAQDKTRKAIAGKDIDEERREIAE